MTIVTRFPPSPTGFLHIGNARTALFNWCYARRHGGKFVLRIEDTDKQRSTDEAVKAVFEAMEWLGLDWDNDEISYQSKNADRHVAVAHELLAQGKAYKCYCTAEELAQMREEAKARGDNNTGYNGLWRDKDDSEAPAETPHVIRIKSPQSGSSTIHDLVQGDVTVENDKIDDFILLRSDGSPTYMLAVVVDDHDMGVTHVMRGDDHLNNAFRQKVIFDAMGWDLPAQAHLPLLHGEDGAKFSKRHGALGVMDYAAQGYLREAMINILLRMGWSHGDEEVISIEQAIEWFDTDGINRAPARFDVQKLNHLNTEWIKALDDRELMQRLLDFKADDDAFAHISDLHKERLVKAMPDLKERATTLVDMANDALIYIADENNPLHFDDKALKNLSADQTATLSHLHEQMSGINDSDWTHEALDALLKETANTLHEGKFGKVGMPLRAALTGRTNSPGHANVMCALGRDETLRRVAAALDICAGTLPQTAAKAAANS